MGINIFVLNEAERSPNVEETCAENTSTENWNRRMKG
jgi:hypothetical protein